MKTEVVSPQDVFYRPRQFRVPLFQRPYVWSRAGQWEPLWQDIERLIEVIDGHDPDASHFLGAIVIQPVDTSLGALTAWTIIDGQQRLTTVQLLLGALMGELNRRQLTDLAGRVRPLIENPAGDCEQDEDRFKVWPANRDREGFAAVMSPSGRGEAAGPGRSRMADAHRYFTEAISGYLGEDAQAPQRARTLVAAITQRLGIASISLEKTDDPQAIFETLNARGTPLTAADLIKNYLFQHIDPAQAKDAYERYWAQFESPWWEEEVTSGRARNSRCSLFLWQWLTARTLAEFPIREVFSRFKHYAATEEKDAGLLLAHLRDSAARYRAVIEGAQNPAGPLSRLELFAYRVGTLNSEICWPLLIWLSEPERRGLSGSDRDQIVAVLESWFVRRALVRAPSQGTNRFVLDLVRHLSESAGSLPAATQNYLAKSGAAAGYWPGDDEVAASLRGANAYRDYVRARLRMVLEALEDHQRGYPDGKRLAMGPIVRKKGSIEHLMPQHWQANWPARLTPRETEERDRAVNLLGNLTLVTQALNSSVSHGSWAAKRDFLLSHDDVLITREAIKIAGDDGWDEAGIAQRTEQMISQILQIWPVPPHHQGRAPQQAMAPTIATLEVADLVQAGWLEPGEMLVPVPEGYEGQEASIARDGRIYVGGRAFDYLSGAARSLTARNTNGWTFWAQASTGLTLAEIRASYLDRLGEQAPPEDLEPGHA